MFTLKRSLSKTHLLFISFTAIFGSGWLFAPFYAAQQAGPASLIAWCLGAVMSAVIGLTMAEVITIFPKTGGLNTVAAITHGELLAFFVTVFNLLVFIVLPVIEVRAIIQYVHGGDISALGYLASFALLALITFVNIYGAKLMALLTSISVIFKVATPLLLCATFLYVAKPATLELVILPIHWGDVFRAIATSGIIFSFNGFNQATVFAGEARNPQKTIPFAIFGALIFSGALYLLVQYVFLISVPSESLVQGWKHLSFVGDQGPFAGLAVILGLNWLLSIIYVDAVISPLGTAFTYASAAPRIFYALADNHHIFSYLMKVNRYGVPYLAIILTFVLECLAFVFFPGLKAMIAILVAAFVLCYTAAPASLLLLRKIQPELNRPFRVPYARVMCYLSLLFSNLMVFSCGWVAIRNLMCFALILGLSTFKFYRQLKSCAWFLLQLVGLGLLAYLDHIGVLEFGMACCVIAFLSLLVLVMSQYSAQPNK